MQQRDGTASAVPFLFPAIVAALTLIALGRVAATYRTFGQTFDEPAHIACGVEIATTGRYTLEPQHPPLARILIGLTAHATLPDRGTVWQRGNAILYAGDYIRTLSAARSGVLPFLAIAIVTTALWARRLYGDRVAMLATLFVSTTPPLLAHAGLATTDAAAAAMTLFALYRFSRWLDGGSAILFGVALGLAFTAKFSALLFVPAGMIAIALVRRPRIGWRQLVVVAVAALLTTWAVYAFSLDAPRQILEGLRVARAHEQGGHPAYLLGRNSPTGWWYFFLVAFAVKMPLATIILLLIGARRMSEPLAVVIAFFLVTMPVNVAIGFRHLLPIVPFAAIVAAQGAALIRWRAVAGLLVAWQVASTTLAHPDYLAYLNEIARRQPDYFLVDSDLDWGQDVLRLADASESNGQPITVAYFGTADLRRHLRVPFRYLRPGEEPRGWIAVSETILRKGKPPGRFAFLDGVPYTMVGKSIRLYFRR